MDQEIFNFFNKQIKKDFGKTASKETFAKFASYCAEGIEKNGVKPIFNWINLYAFGTGMTTAEADRLRIERYKQENAL
ncbi:TPA: hypothetical protein ACQNWS_000235 [Streptococcus pyogenes]|uniref:Phage protein n=7 Tax=Streptococcus pyogenes TaxID=1314 RepID=Q99QB4_STRP1|nr:MULTISPECIES: hypothetical protein [Streptococcus]NP_795496.1 hypothetical protein SpyM3_1138 [Streptococcus phage 315.3]ESA50204.1 hypothetical protein HMPREF1235_1769 [Streptococcus pyogenes GA41208]ESU91062.1 hypothetical protein HMPREF1240_1794 [Streptococcus pyogenes GA03455]QBX19069.1 hypothetical protein Javan467_0008 [Streptococcus phage Javan467]QBX19289.1 hypothetical protein Javan481_0008 [Streptococcus phage Javan481]QBX19489.1 hypothetical protein Javan487_0043 [Streptococcus 